MSPCMTSLRGLTSGYNRYDHLRPGVPWSNAWLVIVYVLSSWQSWALLQQQEKVFLLCSPETSPARMSDILTFWLTVLMFLDRNKLSCCFMFGVTSQNVSCCPLFSSQETNCSDQYLMSIFTSGPGRVKEWTCKSLSATFPSYCFSLTSRLYIVTLEFWPQKYRSRLNLSPLCVVPLRDYPQLWTLSRWFRAWRHQPLSPKPFVLLGWI